MPFVSPLLFSSGQTIQSSSITLGGYSKSGTSTAGPFVNCSLATIDSDPFGYFDGVQTIVAGSIYVIKLNVAKTVGKTFNVKILQNYSGSYFNPGDNSTDVIVFGSYLNLAAGGTQTYLRPVVLDTLKSVGTNVNFTIPGYYSYPAIGIVSQVTSFLTTGNLNGTLKLKMSEIV